MLVWNRGSESVTQDLAKLIAQYRWLKTQDESSTVVSGTDGDSSLSVAIDRVFCRIVNFPSTDPRISYRQIAFLLDVLAADEGSDAEAREFLRDAVLGHVKRLADSAAQTGNTSLDWR